MYNCAPRRGEEGAPRAISQTKVALAATRPRRGSCYADRAPGTRELQSGVTYRTPAACMGRVRADLLARRVVPEVVMATAMNIAKLVVPLRGGSATIVGVPDEAEECLLFCQRVSERVGKAFRYYGDRVETVTARALEELMQSRRGGQKEPGACMPCGDPGAELDHRVPLHTGSGNDPENLQWLCQGWHALNSEAPVKIRTLSCRGGTARLTSGSTSAPSRPSSSASFWSCGGRGRSM